MGDQEACPLGFGVIATIATALLFGRNGGTRMAT
jgi:hypothetical protein